ncbi:transcriptional regulator [Streptomyces capillispiralis]|nr:transcriptional regulator [Streptomyces capillispiralis]
MTVSAQDDVAGFAALLRELKERTDRSYGSLARRLNMNTSTLHRYCAGEAVPVDFAPVERFAALCGASSAERLELHRRWLRAVRARQRPRAADASATTLTEPERETETETKPEPEPATAPGAGSDSGSGPDVHSGPTTPDDPGEPATAPDHPGDPTADPTTDPATGPGEAQEGVVSGPLTGGAGVRRPWYRRRRRVGVALAAVCALLATVGSLSALPDGRRSSGEGRPTAAPGTTGAAGPHGRTSPPAPSGSGSASPSAKATAEGKGKAEAEADTKGDRGPGSSGPAHGPSAPAAPRQSASAGPPPLTWSVDSQVWAHGCGHDYVIAKPPEQVPPPPAPQDAGTWAATQSAVHGGETMVELSVQGTSDTAVVLTGLRVRVAGRADPAPGHAYAMDQGCGGALTPRYFDVDLDKDRPIARAVAGNDAGTPIPAVRMPYRVSATDPEVLLVTARTRGCDCRWYLELDWSSQGRTGTVRIDDRGRPFRTSGIEGLPRHEYDTSARAWRPRAE